MGKELQSAWPHQEEQIIGVQWPKICLQGADWNFKVKVRNIGKGWGLAWREGVQSWLSHLGQARGLVDHYLRTGSGSSGGVIGT